MQTRLAMPTRGYTFNHACPTLPPHLVATLPACILYRCSLQACRHTRSPPSGLRPHTTPYRAACAHTIPALLPTARLPAHRALRHTHTTHKPSTTAAPDCCCAPRCRTAPGCDGFALLPATSPPAFYLPGHLPAPYTFSDRACRAPSAGRDANWRPFRYRALPLPQRAILTQPFPRCHQQLYYAHALCLLPHYAHHWHAGFGVCRRTRVFGAGNISNSVMAGDPAAYIICVPAGSGRGCRTAVSALSTAIVRCGGAAPPPSAPLPAPGYHRPHHYLPAVLTFPHYTPGKLVYGPAPCTLTLHRRLLARAPH